ncbi:MAG: glycosyltransferase 87 family protein [Candidatus Hydrogenedentota bacterium]
MPWLPAPTPRLRECLPPGIVLLLLFAAITWLSPQFEYGSDMLSRPIIPFITLMLLAGIVYLYAVWRMHRVTNSPRFIIALIAVGLGMRALFFFSQPILEDDFYRYLWEGGMVANGHSPYAHPPNDARFFDADSGATPELIALGDQAGITLDRVNHGSLTTVYPPTTQAAFAIAHFIKPWSLNAWRSILLLFDLGVCVLILLILRKVERPYSQLIIYWWNPILIKESFNSAHMDLIIVFFVMLAILAIVYQRINLTGIALALATAAKLWPLYLIPLFLRFSRALSPDRRRALTIAGILLLILMIPIFISSPLSDDSGFTAYSERWEMNDALFMGINKVVHLSFASFQLEKNQLAMLARLLTLILLLIWIAVLMRRDNEHVDAFMNHLVLAVGLLFMLSPTQFPWYYIWLLPLLALSPRLSYLTLSLTLPLYYLRFYYAALDQTLFFDNTIVWIEYAPVIALLIYEHIRFKLGPAEYAGIINA